MSACDLKQGDKVLLANAELSTNKPKYGTVVEVKTEDCEPFTTYNFEVADFHTYFVGENGICVHNICKQARLSELADDPKVYSELRGEIKMSKIHSKSGNYKVPKGYELRHRPGFEAFKGYGY